MRYPNQISVEISKVDDFKDPTKTCWYHYDALSEAYQSLSKSAFALWLYLMRNQTNFKLNLSYVAFNQVFPMSERSYRDAKQELEEKGYLVFTNRSLCTCYEIPQNEMKIEPEIPATQEIDLEQISSYTLSHLAEPYQDLGNGVVQLSNGKTFRRQLTSKDF